MSYYLIFILAGHSRALGRWRPEDLKLEAIVACVVRSVSEAKATIDREELCVCEFPPSTCALPLDRQSFAV